MPNHGENLQHHHNEQSMKHSSYKKRYREKEIEKNKKNMRKEERKKHNFPMVNKKISKMLIVCLPCHFDYGIAPVSCARDTPLFYYCCYFAIATTKLLLLINYCEQDYFQVQLN